MLIRMLKQNFSYLEIKKKEKKKNKTNHSFKLSGPRRRKSKNIIYTELITKQCDEYEMFGSYK